MRITYKWKRNFRLKETLDADAVGRELDALRRRGDTSPEAIWRHARSRRSAMHDAFTWDVQRAAEERWEDQARYILRHHILATIDDEPVVGEVRSTLYIPGEGEDGPDYEHGEWVYVPAALSEDEGRQRLLGLALAELEYFSRKYQHLSELANVFEAIEEAAARYRRAQQRKKGSTRRRKKPAKKKLAKKKAKKKPAGRKKR